MSHSTHIIETEVNIIGHDTKIHGKIILQHTTRVHGSVYGDIQALPDSLVVLCENSLVQGNIQAETLVVDGFVRGDIRATKKVTVSQSGRIIGNIYAPSIVVEFGAYFEGRCSMGEAGLSPQPA